MLDFFGVLGICWVLWFFWFCICTFLNDFEEKRLRAIFLKDFEEKRLRAISSELSLKNKNIRTSKVPQLPKDKNLSEKVKNIKAQNEEMAPQ